MTPKTPQYIIITITCLKSIIKSADVILDQPEPQSEPVQHETRQQAEVHLQQRFQTSLQSAESGGETEYLQGDNWRQCL